MTFSAVERTQLLTAKFVGETVIARLEQMGIHSLAQLAAMPAQEYLTQVQKLLVAVVGRIAHKQKRQLLMQLPVQSLMWSHD